MIIRAGLRAVTMVAVSVLANPVANSCGTPPPKGSSLSNDTYRVWSADIPAGTPFYTSRSDARPCAVTQQNVVNAPIWQHIGPWGSIESFQHVNGLPSFGSHCRYNNQFWVRWNRLRHIH